jgi:hypothetical protein
VSNIFLSYRRDDAGGWAGRLSDSLRKALPGAVVFMDVDNIPPGVRFADYISDAVAKCQVLIVLIGPHWASEKNLRRLQDQKDFVHAEIAAALKLGVRVIPTRVGEAPLPASASLPEDLRELLDRNDFVISDRSWDDDCRRLSEALRPLVRGVRHERRAVEVHEGGRDRWLGGGASRRIHLGREIARVGRSCHR